MKNLKSQYQDNSCLEKKKHKSQTVIWTHKIYKPGNGHCSSFMLIWTEKYVDMIFIVYENIILKKNWGRWWILEYLISFYLHWTRYCLFGTFFSWGILISFPEKCVRSDLALILEGLFLISGHKACPAMLYLWTEKVTMPDTCKVWESIPITLINAHQLQ